MGHSALVVDGKNEISINANSYFTPTNLISAYDIFVRPAFMILRVNADKEVRDSVASYAKENLVGLQYDILAGIFEDKAPKTLKRTHCSHIIWYAYNRVGIDLDGSGGKIITPIDITLSSNVSIVQVFGIDVTQYNV